MSIRISEMSLARPRRTGRRSLVAIFSVEFGGVRLNNCTLCKFSNGELRSFPPTHGDGPRHPIDFLDLALREKITRAASEAYDALRGRA